MEKLTVESFRYLYPTEPSSSATSRPAYLLWNSCAAALQIEEEGEMKPAGMGRGEDLWHGEQSRGDRILWITDGIRGTGKLPQVLYCLSTYR